MSGYRQPGTHGSPYTGSTSPRALTSERIAADIAAFNEAGGCIEVLGNAPLHRRSAEPETTAGENNTTMAKSPSPVTNKR